MDYGDITHVLIENQISPIAGRMKTLQGVLTEYFVIRHPSAQIRYISSSNKLKTDVKAAPEVCSTNDTVKEKTTYADHKKDAIQLCRNKIGGSSDWLSMLDACKKKDDLADCYLQGCWFIDQLKKGKE